MFWKRSNEEPRALPQTLARHLPDSNVNSRWEALEDGGAVVAGSNALVFVEEQGVKDSGLWHEVQYAKWDALTRQLTVVWIQPERPPVRVTTASDNPDRLMEAVTVRVEKTILATRSFFTSQGTRVSASIRRRPGGGLFSTVIVDGPVTDADVEKAEKIEADLRAELGVEE